MPEAIQTLAVYLHLARASGQRRQPLAKDKLLILAAAAAAESGLDEVSAYCRRAVLRHNPQHLLREWPTIEDALAAADFQAFLKKLRREYSSERAEHLLDSLGIQVADERRSYFSDHEYAVALLGHTPESIAVELARPINTSVDDAAPADRKSSLIPPNAVRTVFVLLALVAIAGLAFWWSRRL